MVASGHGRAPRGETKGEEAARRLALEDVADLQLLERGHVAEGPASDDEAGARGG